MSHPYTEFEGTALWSEIEAEISELEASGDLALTTARPYVIGALCQRLASAGLVASRSSDSPSA